MSWLLSGLLALGVMASPISLETPRQRTCTSLEITNGPESYQWSLKAKKTSVIPGTNALSSASGIWNYQEGFIFSGEQSFPIDKPAAIAAGRLPSYSSFDFGPAAEQAIVVGWVASSAGFPGFVFLASALVLFEPTGQRFHQLDPTPNGRAVGLLSRGSLQKILVSNPGGGNATSRSREVFELVNPSDGSTVKLPNQGVSEVLSISGDKLVLASLDSSDPKYPKRLTLSQLDFDGTLSRFWSYNYGWGFTVGSGLRPQVGAAMDGPGTSFLVGPLDNKVIIGNVKTGKTRSIKIPLRSFDADGEPPKVLWSQAGFVIVGKTTAVLVDLTGKSSKVTVKFSTLSNLQLRCGNSP
jgi:hypothetical protein